MKKTYYDIDTPVTGFIGIFFYDIESWMGIGGNVQHQNYTKMYPQPLTSVYSGWAVTNLFNVN